MARAEWHCRRSKRVFPVSLRQVQTVNNIFHCVTSLFRLVEHHFQTCTLFKIHGILLFNITCKLNTISKGKL